MLEKILAYLNNWFVVEDGIHEGKFNIQDSSITLPFLVEGQYFRICGSVFNDGVYIYPANNLKDEEFEGTVWALAIPKQLTELSDEIKAWKKKNGNPSVYTSESFGGYSYSKDSTTSTWQGAFKSQLNQWRKIRDTSAVLGTRKNIPYKKPWNPDYPFGGDV